MIAPSAIAVLRAVDPTALRLYLVAARHTGRVTQLRTHLRRRRQAACPAIRAALRTAEVAMVAALGDRG